MHIVSLCKVDYFVKTSKGDISMKKSGRGKVRNIKEDTLIVTIDIGLEMNRGYCTTTDRRDTKPFRFDNTREGLDKLWSMIVVNKNRFRCSEVIVGYESTGPYGEPIGHYLAKKPVTVAGLIGEVGNFRRFRTQSEIMKLAGLDLYEVSSGKWKGRRRISKRGRSLIRKILYYAAMQTIRKHGIMHEYYTRLTGRGMKRMMALIADSRKLLRILHAVMRDDREYIVNYESVKRQVIKKAA
jgi:transposase